MTVLTSPPATTLAVRSPFVVRLAGLPAAAVATLSAPALLAAVNDALAAEESVAARGRELADELYPVIGSLDDPAYRPALVGLRRALFGARTPRPAEWTPRLRLVMPGALATRIDGWLAALARRDELTAAVASTLDRETDASTAALLRLAGEPSLRHGLVQSSPALSAELDKWLADPHRPPARQTAARLARYVSRAATKTSPFSTFTTIGAGVFGDTDPDAGIDAGLVLDIATLPESRGRLELHGPVLAEVATVLAAAPDLRPAMVVRLNPSLTRMGDRLVVLGPPPRERISSVAVLPEVLRIVAALGNGWHPRDALTARLAAGTPPGPGRDDRRIDAFVDKLVEAGVLEARLPVEDQCPDWFGALAEWLRAAGSARWAGVERACERLSARLRRPTDPTDVDGHRERLTQIRRTVAELRSEAGLTADPTGETALLHEHTAYLEPVATASRPGWEPALADLDRVRRWLARHDPALPLRLALGSYHRERFGPNGSVPFLIFYRTLLADLGEQRSGRLGAAVERIGPVLDDLTAELTPGAPAPAYRSIALRRLAARRRRSLEALLGATPDADGVIRADLAALDPRPGDPARSVAWFVQPAGDRLVVNAAMSGYGRGRFRSLYLIAQANGGELPVPVDDDPPARDGDAIVADSSGAFGHTLNLRLNPAGYELDYPYTLRLTEPRPTVALRDLMVELDPVTGCARLRDAGRGAVVTPVHAGMVVQAGLPRALQLLTRGLGANPGWLFRPADLLAPPPEAATPGGVRFAPRIEAGSIVLRRAAWTADAESIPRRAAGEPAADALLRLHRWLGTHAIPVRCFVTATGATPSGVGAGPAGATTGVTKARKPLYVDLASPWLVAMFEHLTAGATEVTFAEALPAVDTQPGHVTELVLETEDPA